MLSHQEPSEKASRSYRRDIDGLRAIAVLSVVLFHISNSFLPNGYLGVDIFFVLSGYLITANIWKEVRAADFSIARFYVRRTRRIMPALLTVLLVASIFATILLLPIDLMGYAKSVFASLGFVANVYFWRDTDYFARIAEVKPLLHLWSLGVEEQFYIFFPLLIVLCGRKRRTLLIRLIAALVVISLLMDIVAIRNGASAPAFFLIPTRAWELGAGSLLSFFTTSNQPKQNKARHGLALLAAGLLCFGLSYTHPQLPGEFPAVYP